MMDGEHGPLSWLQGWASALGWPVVAFGAFWAGRYVQRLEMRVTKAEDHIKQIVERHLPAIHRALAEIRGLLIGGR